VSGSPTTKVFRLSDQLEVQRRSNDVSAFFRLLEAKPEAGGLCNQVQERPR
jgi:hypothetical protein